LLRGFMNIINSKARQKKVRVLENQYLTRYNFINYMLIGQLQASHSAETITAFSSSI